MILAALLLAAASPDPAAATARAFQKCISCHSLDPAETGLPGPSLGGVLGRRAASLPGFDYSPAMRAAGAGGLAWTNDKLDAFLANPEALVPGTMMQKPPPTSAEERALLYGLFTH